MHAIWNRNYLNNIKILQNKSEIGTHITRYESEMKKLFSKRAEYLKWEKYFQHVIQNELNNLKISLEEGNDNNVANISTKSNKNQQLATKSKDHIINLEISNEIYSYDLNCMIRCHSINGNPQDDTTMVYDAAFEPQKFGKNKFTNVCATCGGSIINFIDVSTGKVIKRFVETKVYHNTKEVSF